MVRSLISMLLAATVSLAAGSAFAEPKEPRDGKAARERVTAPPQKPIARPQANSCAQFGAGFVRLPGSDSCVRMGGGVDVGVGGSR
jgi:hypothetical protein